MSETQSIGPTPGPWTIEPSPGRALIAQVGGVEGVSIWTERIFDSTQTISTGDALADARIMAAGQDTLAALQAVIPALADVIKSDTSTFNAWFPALQAAVVAVEKATGVPQAPPL